MEAERNEGKTPEDAIYEACLLRFRPIMMTTMAALLGALPLALGTGAGSELRRPLGIAIIGGLIVSQMLTLYTTPVVYLYLDRLRWWFLRHRARAVDRHITGASFAGAFMIPMSPISESYRGALVSWTTFDDNHGPRAPDSPGDASSRFSNGAGPTAEPSLATFFARA